MIDGLMPIRPHGNVFVFSRIEELGDRSYGFLGIECTAPSCLPLMQVLESYVAQRLPTLEFAALTFENHRGYVRGGANPYSKWADGMLLYLLGIYDEIHLKELEMRPLNEEGNNFSKAS